MCTCISVLPVYVHTSQENDRLKQDMVTMEKAITERMGYLQRHKVDIYMY